MTTQLTCSRRVEKLPPKFRTCLAIVAPVLRRSWGAKAGPAIAGREPWTGGLSSPTQEEPVRLRSDSAGQSTSRSDLPKMGTPASIGRARSHQHSHTYLLDSR
jgi:hypothetical protein